MKVTFVTFCVTEEAFHVRCYQGRTQGGGVGVKSPLEHMIFYKILLPTQRRLIVFAYFLLVNLSL